MNPKSTNSYNSLPQILIESQLANCDTKLVEAAMQGDVDAQVRLAHYHWAEEVYDRAVHWFRLAAQKGSLEALHNLGCLSEYGPAFVHNAGNPVEWHNKALALAQKTGNDFYRKRSLERLGYCYEMGLGCEKDLDKALEYYKRGAEEDALFCNESVGNLLFSEGKYKEALSYFLKEKSLTARSYFQMGEMYENGWGTNIDLYQASLCYKKAQFYENDTEMGKKTNAKLCSVKFYGIKL